LDTYFSELAAAALERAPKESSSQDLDRDAFLSGWVAWTSVIPLLCGNTSGRVWRCHQFVQCSPEIFAHFPAFAPNDFRGSKRPIRPPGGVTMKRRKVLVFSETCRFIHRALRCAGDIFANAPFSLFPADPA
jgi:hypothetical protein